MSVFPEIAAVRGDVTSAPWRIERGSRLRGDASCDLGGRVLRVPLGADARARVVRAHELIHARVSPAHATAPPAGVTPRALECAEEFRVNTIGARLGFPVEELVDGSERRGGEQLAQAGEWDEALCFWLAVLGTGAERGYLAGIRRHSPDWASALRAVRTRVLTLVKDRGPAELGSTVLGSEGLPLGYTEVTIPVARLVSSLLGKPPGAGDEGRRRVRERLRTPPGRLVATGRFADLVLGPDLAVKSRHASGSPRWRPSVEGVALRYPSRLLVDDQRRAFAHRAAGRGGVVVLDQSGSMDLQPAQLTGLVAGAPGSWVLGYSHRPGDDGSTPNAWILADPRHQVVVPPRGHVGNGVDGPALAWALRRRRPGEAVVWVTDGQVTDSNDFASAQLAAQCAQLVRTRRIILVRDLDEASDVLRGCRPRHRASSFGRVGRALSTLDRD